MQTKKNNKKALKNTTKNKKTWNTLCIDQLLQSLLTNLAKEGMIYLCMLVVKYLCTFQHLHSNLSKMMTSILILY